MTGVGAAIWALSLAASAAQLPGGAGAIDLSAGTGWRHAAYAGLSWTPVDGVAIGTELSVRHDRPRWTPAAAVQLRVGQASRGWNPGLRLDAEWLGGLGGGGRVPGVDTRGFALVEHRSQRGVDTHFGAGLMTVVTRHVPVITCVVARTGISLPVSARTDLGASVELPLGQLTGPPIPGIIPAVVVGLRMRLGEDRPALDGQAK